MGENMTEILRWPTARNRTELTNQIRDALKIRQHVEIQGNPIATRKLLDDLIRYENGKAIILPLHPEDFTFHIMLNIGFPSSDKINIEGIMRQVLLEFGWPAERDIGRVNFFFGRLMELLYFKRIVPVFLFEHPEVMKEKSFRMLEIISDYEIDRKRYGIPSILCLCGSPQYSLSRSSLHIELKGEITRDEIYGVIEEVSPGKSMLFDEEVITYLADEYFIPRIKVIIKELINYMRKLGLKKINYDLYAGWKEERRLAYAEKKA